MRKESKDGRIYHGNFIFSKIRKWDQRRVYFAMIQIDDRRITRKAGYRLADATKLRHTWKNQVAEGTFLHPKRRVSMPKLCPYCKQLYNPKLRKKRHDPK